MNDMRKLIEAIDQINEYEIREPREMRDLGELEEELFAVWNELMSNVDAAAHRELSAAMDPVWHTITRIRKKS